MRFSCILFCLLPLAAGATKLANCDGKPYDVTITNAGQAHRVHFPPYGGAVEEYGPVVSFRIDGQWPVTVTEPYDEYCIWSGRIKLQTRNIGNGLGGGSGLR